MKSFIPKSYRVKHKILQFLSKERMKNGGLNPNQQYTFTLREISERINESYDDVYSITDYLFYKKLIHCKKNDNEIINPNCFVTDQGIEAYSSFKYINDGKLLQTTLFNNLSTGFFQIVVGIVAVVTILFNYKNSEIYYNEINSLSKKVNQLSTQSKIDSININLNNSKINTLIQSAKENDTIIN